MWCVTSFSLYPSLQLNVQFAFIFHQLNKGKTFFVSQYIFIVLLLKDLFLAEKK